MNRKETLEAAAAAVLDRGISYGCPEDNFGRIADLWYSIGFEFNGERIEERHVALALILLKVARQSNAPKDDNWVDIAGYAACGAEVDHD